MNRQFFFLPGLILLLGLLMLSSAVATQTPKEGLDIVQQKCTACHDTQRICAHLNVYDGQQWDKTVARMAEHGAKVDAGQQKTITAYLASSPDNFPDCAADAGAPALGAFTTLLMLGHPLLMLANIGLALWVLFLGVQRFRSSTLGQRARFPWKTHVRLGYAVMAVFLAGMIAGPTMTTIFWGEAGTTGTHFQNGLLMLPLIIIGAVTGWRMNHVKTKRKVMPIVHGLNNLLLVLLALCQLTTGAQLVFALLG